jgi:putative ABC transport system permease protein
MRRTWQSAARSFAMYLETFRMSFQVLTRSPGRSALTVLGLAIGVAAFIAMVSFGEGARRSVLQQFESLGVNVLRVRPRAGTGDALSRPVYPLSDADVAALRRDATTIAMIVPQVRRMSDLLRGPTRVRTPVVGTTPDYLKMHGWQFQYGGAFDAIDEKTAAKVCVLGATPARNLFGDEDPTGGTVTIAGKFACRVIGVLAPKGRAISGNDFDDFALIPVRTFRTLLGMEGYASFDLRPGNPAWQSVALAEADQILRRMHHYGPDEAADFYVVSPDDVTHAADQTAQLLAGLLASIAAVSLLVGGIGIMNIQLIAVTERTHEIGIRAAIGAAPQQILLQFLVESCVLAAAGALIGVAIGVGASETVAHLMHWGSATSWATVLGSALFGIGVGVVFGYIPALRAARLDPVVALRRE